VLAGGCGVAVGDSGSAVACSGVWVGAAVGVSVGGIGVNVMVAVGGDVGV
jgi:hypothetical protein